MPDETSSPKTAITTSTVTAGGAMAVLGLIVTNLNSISPFVDKLGLPACIAIGCLVFGGAIILLMMQWLGSHGATTAASLRANVVQQTQILGEMRTKQESHGEVLLYNKELLRDIHQQVVDHPRPTRKE